MVFLRYCSIYNPQALLAEQEQNIGAMNQTVTGGATIVDEFISTRETSFKVNLCFIGDNGFHREFEHRYSILAKNFCSP
jgi:hypothetical protein